MLRLLELGARADARLLQMLLALEFVLLIAERIARGRKARKLLAIGCLRRPDLHARD